MYYPFRITDFYQYSSSYFVADFCVVRKICNRIATVFMLFECELQLRFWKLWNNIFEQIFNFVYSILCAISTNICFSKALFKYLFLCLWIVQFSIISSIFKFNLVYYSSFILNLIFYFLKHCHTWIKVSWLYRY